MSQWGTAFGTGTATGTTFQLQMVPAVCQVCSDPANVSMKRAVLVDILEEVRKITHPDVCSHKKANEVTAKVNACLTEIRLDKAKP